MLQYGSTTSPTFLPAGRASRLERFLGQSLRAISGQVACGRSALWVFDRVDGVDGARSLRCLRSHDAVTDEIRPGSGPGIESGAQLLFDALRCEGHVVGGPGSGHEALEALAEHAFFGAAAQGQPAAQMAAAFSLNGRLLGALVCSRPTAGEGWSQRQAVTLNKASASVALSLNRDGETAFWTLLGRLLASSGRLAWPLRWSRCLPAR